MGIERIREQVFNEEVEKGLVDAATKLYGKGLGELDDAQVYNCVLQLTKELTASTQRIRGDKKVYYISAEFLIGKLLANNLINLGIYDKVKEVLAKYGKNIADIEEAEDEPSLGNGGLGRLAACFLDSIATLGLCGDGIGLNYHFGLFRQEFEDRLQKATPDKWLSDNSWLH